MAALAAPSCQTCPVESQVLLAAPDFSGPEVAGRSFFAALGCDDGPAEYRAFGETLKERYGATLDLYLLGRAELRAELGVAAGQAWRLEPLSTTRGEPGTWVHWGLGDTVYVSLLMLSQHYFEIVEDDGRRVGALLDQPPSGSFRREGRRLLLELEDPVLRSVGDGSRIAAFELATEWKIADFRLPEDDA